MKKHRCAGQDRYSVLKTALLLGLLLITGLPAAATHFRYGNLTWSRDPINPLKVHFKLTESWRRGFPWNQYNAANPVPPNVGNTINFGSNFPLNFGDNTSTNIVLTVTSISVADDWIFGVFEVDHTYGSAGSYTAFMEGAARLSSPLNNPPGQLQNNGDLSFRIESNLTIGPLINNSAPVSTLPPIVNMVIGNPAAHYQIPATDPDNDNLTFSLALSTAFTQTAQTPCTQPLGLSVSSSGLLTFNTTSQPTPGAFYPSTVMAIGKFFNGVIRISDGKGGVTNLDVLIKITGPSSPPEYDYTITPADNFTYNVIAGQSMNYTIKASDPDNGDNVTLFGNGVPPGSTLSPSLPTSGPATAGAVRGYVQSSFSWTPTAAQVGSYVTTYIAQDPQGVQTPTTVKVNVSCNTSFTASKQDVECNLPGSITITSVSGTGPFQFSKDGGATFASGTVPFTFSGLPAATYDIRVKGSNGCISAQSITISNVPDGTPPTINCPGNISVNADPGVCGAVVKYPTVVATDNCACVAAPVSGYTYIGSFNGHNYYKSNTQTDWTTANANAMAAGGHLATLTSAAEDAFLAANGGGYGYIGLNDEAVEGVFVWSNGEATAYTHWCGGEPNNSNGGEDYVFTNFGSGCWNDATNQLAFSFLELDCITPQRSGPASGSVFPIGTTTVTYTATDGSNNSASCSFTVTVADDQAPTITCPANVTIACTASSLPANTGTATATDNCSATISSSDAITPGNCAGNYTISRVWTATDPSNNTSSCTQIITVEDKTGPTIVCPANVTIACTADNTPAGTGTATATDDCSGATVSYSDATTAGNCPGNYVISRTWTATDGCGNSSSCTQTITVQDLTAPTITCPSDKTIACTADNTPTGTGTATATDDCSGATVTYSDVTTAGNCPGNYVITRTWKATDGCGNSSSCTQTITLQDLTAPTITCPSGQTIACTADNTPAGTGTATATDDCSGATVTYTDLTTAGNCPGNYVITRTWKATDACGNSSTCTQTITVQDLTPPTAICKNVTVTLVNGTATITAAMLDNGSSDDCSGIDSRTISKSSFDCSNAGSNNVTLTVKDACGNQSTCTATVTVVGAVPSCSIAVTPSNSTYTGGIATNIYLGYGPPGATLTANPSGGGTFSYSWSGPTGYLSCDNCKTPVFTPTIAGTYTFTVTVTNNYGCKTTCSVSFCVRDIRVPGNGNSGKVYVCHVPAGNPANSNTLSISASAVPTHIGSHPGDRLGTCEQSCGANVTARQVANRAIEEEVKVYPNPNNGSFVVEIPYTTSEQSTITVTDVQGRVIQRRAVTDNDGRRINLHLGSVARGMYLVDVVYGDHRFRTKVFVQ